MEQREGMRADQDRMRVLVAGGGVAGLETVLALAALARDLVRIELISPDEEFVHRPTLVAEPFGAAEVLRIDLDQVVADTGARHIKDALSAVDPGNRVVELATGDRLSYDALVLALGARPVESVPGALTFSGADGRRLLMKRRRDRNRSGLVSGSSSDSSSSEVVFCRVSFTTRILASN